MQQRLVGHICRRIGKPLDLKSFHLSHVAAGSGANVTVLHNVTQKAYLGNRKPTRSFASSIQSHEIISLIPKLKMDKTDYEQLKNTVDGLRTMFIRDIPSELADNNFTFPLPLMKDEIYEDPMPWYWGNNKLLAPFFDRNKMLLVLLHDAYRNFSGMKSKPIVDLFTSIPGFGKTRLMLEWAARAFNRPSVIASFLEVADLAIQPPLIHTALPMSQVLNKATGKKGEFLSLLHQTLKQSRILTMNSKLVSEDLLTLPNADEILVQLLFVQNICTRFEGREFTLNGVKVTIPETATLPLVLGNTTYATPKSLLALFHHLIDEVEKPYTPLEELKSYYNTAHKLTLVGIDECQVLLARQMGNKSLFYNFAKRLYTLPKVHCVAVGLYDENASSSKLKAESITLTLRAAFPLDSLLSLNYLQEIALRVYGMSLNQSFYPQAPPGPTIDKELTRWLITVWVMCGGIPRAIEKFVTTLEQLKPKAKNFPYPTIKSTIDEYLKSKTFEDSCKEFGFKREIWLLRLLELAFCVKHSPDELVDPSHTITFGDLENKGLIVPFSTSEEAPAFTSPPKSYTQPFFYHRDQLDNAIPELQGRAIKTPDFESVDVTIQHCVQSFGYVEDAPTTKGRRLEEAAAVSAWFRYLIKTKLKADEPVPIKEILPFINSNDLFAKWNSVVQLQSEFGIPTKVTQSSTDEKVIGKVCKLKEDFPRIYKSIGDHGVIALNKYGAHYGEVLLPLYRKTQQGELQFEMILAVQCCNTARDNSKTKPATLMRELEQYFNHDISGAKVGFVVLSPKMPDKLLSERLTKEKMSQWEKELKLSTTIGTNWLSLWFLTLYKEIFPEELSNPTEE